MKFVLMLSVCSFVTGECKEPIEYDFRFNTWKECAMAALDTSQKYLDLQDEATINKYRLATKFSCEAIEET